MFHSFIFFRFFFLCVCVYACCLHCVESSLTCTIDYYIIVMAPFEFWNCIGPNSNCLLSSSSSMMCLVNVDSHLKYHFESLLAWINYSNYFNENVMVVCIHSVKIPNPIKFIQINVTAQAPIIPSCASNAEHTHTHTR